MYENIYHYSETRQADLLRGMPRPQSKLIHLQQPVSISERAGDVLIAVGQRLKGRSKSAPRAWSVNNV